MENDLNQTANVNVIQPILPELKNEGKNKVMHF